MQCHNNSELRTAREKLTRSGSCLVLVKIDCDQKTLHWPRIYRTTHANHGKCEERIEENFHSGKNIPRRANTFLQMNKGSEPKRTTARKEIIDTEYIPFNPSSLFVHIFLVQSSSGLCGQAIKN